MTNNGIPQSWNVPETNGGDTGISVTRRLIGLLGLFALMACSHGGGPGDVAEPEQPPVENSTPIAFAAAEQQENAVTRSESGQGCTRSQTRAEGLEEKGVTSFRVWGYKNTSYDNSTGSYGDLQPVFPGYTVNWIANSANTTASNSDDWEYAGIGEQSIKYWDWAATAYRFFAATGTTATSESTGANGEATYQITMTANASSDEEIAATPYYSTLWFSTGSYEDYPTQQFGKPVQLSFVKPFSRVRFIFRYTIPREGINLDKTNLQFKPTTSGIGIARKGSVTVIYPLTGTATKEWFDTAADYTNALTAFTEDYDPEDDMQEYTETDQGWYTVVPNIHQGGYMLTVGVNNVTKYCFLPEEYMKWLPGYSYTYIFKITDEGGVEIDRVESAYTDWTEIGTTHTVYNW